VDYNSLDKGGALGVKVTFQDPATRAHKVLYYFSADLSDDGLKRNSAVLRFCNSLGPTNSLLKAASYLLHQNGFSIARDYLLRVSASILQDDSGVPLRYYNSGKMDSTILWYLHRTNQSVQKLLSTGSSPVLCHKLAKAVDVRFRLSLQPAGCDGDTCGAKVNSKESICRPSSLTITLYDALWKLLNGKLSAAYR
jgi:hypothetical protein